MKSMKFGVRTLSYGTMLRGTMSYGTMLRGTMSYGTMLNRRTMSRACHCVSNFHHSHQRITINHRCFHTNRSFNDCNDSGVPCKILKHWPPTRNRLYSTRRVSKRKIDQEIPPVVANERVGKRTVNENKHFSDLEQVNRRDDMIQAFRLFRYMKETTDAGHSYYWTTDNHEALYSLFRNVVNFQRWIAVKNENTLMIDLYTREKYIPEDMVGQQVTFLTDIVMNIPQQEYLVIDRGQPWEISIPQSVYKDIVFWHAFVNTEQSIIALHKAMLLLYESGGDEISGNENSTDEILEVATQSFQDIMETRLFFILQNDLYKHEYALDSRELADSQRKYLLVFTAPDMIYQYCDEHLLPYSTVRIISAEKLFPIIKKLNLDGINFNSNRTGHGHLQPIECVFETHFINVALEYYQKKTDKNLKVNRRINRLMTYIATHEGDDQVWTKDDTKDWDSEGRKVVRDE